MSEALIYKEILIILKSWNLLRFVISCCTKYVCRTTLWMH